MNRHTFELAENTAAGVVLRRLVGRFMAQVEVVDGHWMWRAKGGRYGSFSVNYASRPAHAVAYELFVGSVPDGYHVDHDCNITLCVNPAHLIARTPRDNILRSSGLAAENARKTHCLHGHPFDAENTYVTSRGKRQCRTCARRRGREWRQRAAA